MYLRRSSTVKFFICALFGAAIYCEWFVYLAQSHYWPTLECQKGDSSCTKILFIADPQIQGDLAVPPPLSYLLNWDSDRYLKSTFTAVVKKFRPDVLVYLGDLMDEGSISTLPHFHAYAKRLFNIFEMDYPVVQVWIPGDNDIGGENEPIYKEKILEFEKVFEQQPVITFRNISFYKVNAITHSFPQTPEDVSDNNYSIVVSHYPVTSRHVFGHQVTNAVHPDVFFCAHEHFSKYVVQSRDFAGRVTHWLGPEAGNKILNIPRDLLSLYEIYVPTCSYRMGTEKIGYGAAILEFNQQNLQYTVFWSPRRFPNLVFYLVILVIAILYCLVFYIAKLCHRKPKSSIWTSDSVPLLVRP